MQFRPPSSPLHLVHRCLGCPTEGSTIRDRRSLYSAEPNIPHRILQRRSIIDNDAAASCLVKGYSPKTDSTAQQNMRWRFTLTGLSQSPTSQMNPADSNLMSCIAFKRPVYRLTNLIQHATSDFSIFLLGGRCACACAVSVTSTIHSEGSYTRKPPDNVWRELPGL